MENLALLLEMLKQYGPWFFVKKTLLGSKVRLFFTCCFIIVWLILATFFVFNKMGWLFWIILPSMLIFTWAYSLLLKKDYRQYYIQYPGTMRLLNNGYISLTLFKIRDALKPNNKLNNTFIQNALREAETFLAFSTNRRLTSNKITQVATTLLTAVAAGIAVHFVNTASLRLVIAIIAIGMVVILLLCILSLAAPESISEKVKTGRLILQTIQHLLSSELLVKTENDGAVPLLEKWCRNNFLFYFFQRPSLSGQTH